MGSWTAAELRARPPVLALLARAAFPPSPTRVRCGLSGGPDSTALVALAVAAELDVTAVHVDHGLRDSSRDLDAAHDTCRRLGVAIEVHRVAVADGPNLEARARTARLAVLGPDALRGHTADDRAETVLLRLLRGTGLTGLAVLDPTIHPLLRLRRRELVELCDDLGLTTVADPSNVDRRHRRNRIRHDVLPQLVDVADRDVVPLLTRVADHAGDDDELLTALAEGIDPTDAAAVAAAPLPLARRAVRRLLVVDGYPPDAAAVARVVAVARGEARATEVGGGRRVVRRRGRLVVEPTPPG